MRGVEAGCCLCLLVLLLLPVAVKADEAADVFNSLFGADLKQVAATPDPADDVALAARLVAAAETASKQPAFLVLMCDKAWELGKAHPTGHATALKAMELLASCVPARQIACQEKVVIIRQLQYDASRGEERMKAGGVLLASQQALLDLKADAGDLAGAVECGNRALLVARAVKADIRDIQARLDQVSRLQRAAKQVADLKVRLATAPNDAAARAELVRLYLVDLDNPSEAAKYVSDADDPAMRRYVPAAAKPIEDAPELACKELGDWYKGLADQAATPASKGAMLRRAQTYYQRFLMLHTAEDLGCTVATLALKRIDDALAVLGPAPQLKSDPSNMTLDLGNGVAMKLVLIPAGNFLMGSPDSEQGRKADEGPQHEVTISKPFYMGVTEVTQAQYEAVMGKNPSEIKGATNPVENVSWEDADEFCRKLSEKTRKTVRLPTEAEREYACRAGTKTRFSFGDSDSALGDYAWYKSNSGSKTHPVGQKKPNAWGLYDMHGNVTEWCADWRGSYTGGPSTDPQGAVSGNYRVARGGSWYLDNPGEFRCADRNRNLAPTYRNSHLGFRCAMTSSPAPAGPAPSTAPPLPAAAKTVPAGQWLDVPPMLDLAKDVPSGAWKREGGTLSAASQSRNRLVIPVVLPESYELQMSFTRASGQDNLGMILPVGGSKCLLSLGHNGGAVSGLAFINGKDYADNEAAVRPAALVNAKEHTLGVKVVIRADRAEITVMLNGGPYIHWEGPQSALSVDAGARYAPPGCMAIGVGPAYTLRNVRLQVLSGEARLLRTGAPSPAQAPTPADLKRGLVLHFNFDAEGAGGRVTDMSGMANHGRAVGARWTPQGKRGGFEFGPDRQYIAVPDSPSLNPTQLTAAAWIKTAHS